MRWAPAAVLVLLLGCARGFNPSPPASLVGLTVPLLTRPALRLALAARVGDRPAVVLLDPGAQLSLVSDGCRGIRPLSSRLAVAQPFGPDEAFQLARVEGLDLGSGTLADFDAGLFAQKACTVILGDDVLAGVALEVDPASREVHFRASASRDHWLNAFPSSEEVELLTLTRDPRHDWPLVTVRVAQGPAIFTGVLLFSAVEDRTRLFEVPARASGLRPGLELLHTLPLPEGVVLPQSLDAFRSFTVDRVEVARGVGVADVTVELVPGAPPHLPLGVLGADIWGRFDAVIDMGQNLLVLHRPRVQETGSGAQCERDGQKGEDLCFEVTQRHRSGATVVGVAAWRPLPEGGRISFDLVGVDPPCRVGFTFPPSDRGKSTVHELPWARLAEVMPACAQSLAAATRVEPGLFQEGPLEECPGLCAYAQDIATARLTCECQPSRGNLDEKSEAELLRLYRSLLQRERPAPQPEPSDPD